MTFDTGPNFFTDIDEQSRLEVPIPEDFIDHGSPEMMSPT
jgi:hypothetical protein